MDSNYLAGAYIVAIIAFTAKSGIERFKKNIKLKKILDAENLEDSQLTQAQLNAFQPMETTLATLGYSRNKTLSLSLAKSRILYRAYFKPGEAAYLTASVSGSTSAVSGLLRAGHMAWNTEFQDGSLLLTIQNTSRPLYPPSSWVNGQRVPFGTDIVKQLELHQARAAGLKESLPVVKDDASYEMGRQAEHDREGKDLVARGYWTDLDAEHYGVSTRYAVNSLIQFFNPIPARITALNTFSYFLLFPLPVVGMNFFESHLGFGLPRATGWVAAPILSGIVAGYGGRGTNLWRAFLAFYLLGLLIVNQPGSEILNFAVICHVTAISSQRWAANRKRVFESTEPLNS